MGYKELYVGGIFREIAAERGLSIEEFYAKLSEEPELEKAVDERQERLMRETDNVVVQGRIAWYFAKKSPFLVVNFFLAVEPLVGAERQGKRSENSGKKPAEIRRLSDERQENERKHYLDLYDIEDQPRPTPL